MFIIFFSIIAVGIVGFLAYSISQSAPIGIIGSADGPTAVIVPQKNRDLLLEESFHAGDLDNISLKLGADSLDIIETDSEEIIVKQYGRNLNENRIIEVIQSGKTLEIKDINSMTFFSFGFSSESWVEIYLPASYNKNLSVSLASGNMRVHKDLSLQKLDARISSGSIKSDYTIEADKAALSVTSGNIYFNEVSANEFSIASTSGRIIVDNLVGQGNISVVSGNIILSNTTITGDLWISATSGSINLSLTPDQSFIFKGKATSGNIRTYFGADSSSSTPPKTYSATVGENAVNNIDINVVSGNVSIDQADK